MKDIFAQNIGFLDQIPLRRLPGEPDALGAAELPVQGAVLALYRRLAGLSQEELALLLGFGPITLWRWEKGKSKPSSKLFEKLMVFFKESLSAIDYKKI